MANRLIVLFCGIAIALGFLYYPLPDCLHHITVCYSDGTQTPLAPAVYRLLPDVLYRVLASHGGALETFYVATLAQMAMGLVSPFLLYQWLIQWGKPASALIGVMLFTTVWIMALHYWFLSLGSTLEILFILIALNLFKRTELWFIPLVALAALNRETALLIPCIYLAYHGRGTWRKFVVLVLVWASVTALIHIGIGAYPHVLGLLGTFEWNISQLPNGILANLLLMPLAIVAIMGYKRTTSRFKRLAWVAAVYIGAMLVGGSWDEFQRLILPVLPLLLPTLITQLSYEQIGSKPHAL